MLHVSCCTFVLLLLKVAQLQSEFCTKDVFELRISYEKCSDIFPEMFEPLFCVSEKSHKIPAKFPTKFPCKIKKKITDELLQERREKEIGPAQKLPGTWERYLTLALKGEILKGDI